MGNIKIRFVVEKKIVVILDWNSSDNWKRVISTMMIGAGIKMQTSSLLFNGL